MAPLPVRLRGSRGDRLLPLGVIWRLGALSVWDAWVGLCNDFIACGDADAAGSKRAGGSRARADLSEVIVGYPMAKNLRAKIPKKDTLLINDRNTEATDKFVQEVGDGVVVAKSPREVAEKSVRQFSIFLLILSNLYDEHVLSMI